MADLERTLAAMDRLLAAMKLPAGMDAALTRWRANSAALRFHMRPHDGVPLAAILGGTGTGKSTIVNRLLDANLSAASFRRTFTSGPVAISADANGLPPQFLGVPHEPAPPGALPVRGEAGKLMVVAHACPITESITLLDTPDLDGDQPVHHAEADRAFRWCQAILFAVSPEKYQMTELLPYYRLAKRYALPALFIMNKCEEEAAVADYRRQLADRQWPDAQVFAIPRDDAAYEARPGEDLSSLRAALRELGPAVRNITPQQRQEAISVRREDLLSRLRDHVLAPLRQQRLDVDRLVSMLRAMTTVTPGVDVAPITAQLSRRLREQSILYLIGPQRMLDRVRQLPGLLARLPRSAWDVVMRGEVPRSAGAPDETPKAAAAPDFPAILADQFRILQTRIDDVLMDSPTVQAWLAAAPKEYAEAKLPVAEAGKIAEEELADLRQWLEQRWNKSPRDTAMLQKLLSHMPGGAQLVKWSEASPYVLTAVLATTGASFGYIDQIALGGYSLVTWLAEKLSNEVTARTRQANQNIAGRFASLAQQQIDRVIARLESLVPDAQTLAQLERLADELSMD